MTRILLHYLMVAPPRPVRLPPPWAWWDTRALANTEGHTVIQQYNPPNATITFGPDWDVVVLTHPPAMHISTVAEYPDYLPDPLVCARPTLEYVNVRVVWHERPGPNWWQPDLERRRTCRPGDYRIDHRCGQHDEQMLNRVEEIDALFFGPPERWLEWPLEPTIRNGQRMPVDSSGARSAVRCVQCRRGIRPEELSSAMAMSVRDQLGRPTMLCEECVDTFRRSCMTVNQQRQFPRDIRSIGDPRRAIGEPHGDSRSIGLFQQNSDYPRSRAGGAVGVSGDVRPRESSKADRCKPEQHVLDEIEALVNEQLTHTRSGYDHNINQDRCHVCGKGWHGLPGTGRRDDTGEPLGARGCPGAYADDDEIAEWRAIHPD